MPPGSPATTPARSTLVGRDDLLADARALLAGGTGVILRGRSGVGTTRLLREVLAESEPGSVLDLRATASTASIPLGLFLATLGGAESAGSAPAGTHPTSAAPVDEPALVGLAARARAAIAAAPVAIVAVDNLHLADPASAAVLLELARGGMPVAGTVQSGAEMPDAIAALWRDGLAVVLEVPPLTEGESLLLLAAAAGAPVDHGLGRAVFAKCGGHPLLLVTAMAQAVDSGAARRRSGIWVLAGELPPLRDVESAVPGIRALDAGLRRVVEVLSLGGTLGLEQAAALLGEAELERAESAGLVCVEGESALATVGIADPVVADAVRTGLPVLTRRRILRELVESTRARAAGRPAALEERIALARWALDGGDRVDAAELLAVAEAVYVSDPLLCARLVRAAIDAERDIGQTLRLANLLAHLHRMDEAERVLDGVDPGALPGAARGVVPATRAYLLAMVAHEPARAIALLDAAGPADDPAMRGARTTALWALGDFAGSVVVGEGLLAEQDAPVAARAQAAAVLGLVHISRGDRAAYNGVRDVLSGFLPAAASAVPELAATRALQDVLALLNVDRDLAGALRLARAGYYSALERGDDSQRSEFAHLLAWAHVLGGDLAAAMPLLREALASHGMWSRTTRPWIETHYLRALVLAGETAEARVVLEGVLARRHAPVHDVSIALADAGLLAAEGAPDAAGRRCALAGDRVRALGQVERAGAAWFAGLRYGDSGCARRLIAQAHEQPGSVTAEVEQLARARLNHDAAGAERAADAFAGRGLLWYALDAQALAVALAVERGGDTARATARLGILRDRAPGFGAHGYGPHGFGALGGAGPLGGATVTGREREVARLAAGGASDREIAERLGISVRTVNAHLRNLYAKLGLHSRAGLRGLVD